MYINHLDSVVVVNQENSEHIKVWVTMEILYSLNKLCPSSSYSDGNVRWSRRVLPPGESRLVCTALPVKVRKRDRQTDKRTVTTP